MDQTELHYLTYDPDEIMTEMMLAYMDAGGDVLYPGDEKEMLLRAVQQIMVQAFAGIDNALRMDTLRYAVRDYLDIYGEKRNCYRIQAAAATAGISIEMSATGAAATIEAGTVVTEDGVMLYALNEDISVTGNDQTVTTTVTCTKAGSAGNGLTSGAAMQFIVPIDGVISVTCTTGASGGQEKEDDETYRERIREYGLASVTTGPARQYESAAEAVSSEIVDAKAIRSAAGVVSVYLILKSQTGAAAILAAVLEALSATDTRPLTDHVTVTQATDIPYVLNAQVTYDSGSVTQTAIQAAIDEYQEWQDNTIGRAFNPDMLMALLYQAGATRVTWGSGSHFNNGAVTYTEIASNERCSGTITFTAA